MTDFERFKQAANARPQQRAPYTFVPTPQKVLPSPTENLDLLRPVEGAISGTLTVSWTNETPMLVGGREDNTSPFRVGNDYMLPGASTRGLTRATLEIASFARLSFIDEFTGYSRDTQDRVWRDMIAPYQGMPINGGWLFCADGAYHLLPAEQTRRYPFSNLLNDFNIGKNKWHDLNLFERINLLKDHNRYGLHLMGGRREQIVVSGPTPNVSAFRTPPKGKTTEHIFVWPDDESTIKINSDIARKFLTSLNHDPRERKKTPPKANYSAYTYDDGIHDLRDKNDRPSLNEQLQNPARWALPVFWRNRRARNDQAQPKPDTILSLTAMLRVPYETSVHDIISRTQPAVGEDYDFVQALFGWAPLEEARATLAKRSPQERALRSRVDFGFAAADKGNLGLEKTWVATKPKPSFYPFYLRPLGGEVRHPVDYNNMGAILAGRKRYPARAGAQALPTEGNEDMRTTLRFLDKGSRFTQTIRVHNISPVELGGLLWALTFGQIGSDDKPLDKGYRHMLGRAKAWGYGQMRVEIAENTLTRVVAGGAPKLHESLQAFTDWVAAEMGQPFAEIESIRTLLNTAHAETGKALAGALSFPEASSGTASEKILKGYVAIKKKALDNHGKAVKDVGEIGLPRYPKVP